MAQSLLMPTTVASTPDSAVQSADPSNDRSGQAPSLLKGLRFRGDIEGLRAVAVLLVVFGHLGVPGFRAGFVGVDVFFVISGYLITSLLANEYAARAEAGERGRISIRGFYRRRVLRILPAALTTIAAVLVAGRLLLNSIAFVKIQADAFWAVLFGTNIQLINESTDYFRAGLPDSTLQNFWSLAVEEQFYLVWPVLFSMVALVASKRVRKAGWRKAVRAAVVVLGLCSFAWSIRSAGVSPAAGYFSTFTRAWQLAFGAFIALGPSVGLRFRGRRAAAAGVAGILLLVAALAFCHADNGYPGYQAVLPVLGAGLLICVGLAGAGANPVGRLLSMRGPKAIGRISYSLYLWHWPLIVFAALLYGRKSSHVDSRLLIFALSIAIATASYFLIEKPYLRLRHAEPKSVRGGSSKLRTVWMVLVAAFAVGSIGALARPLSATQVPLPQLGPEPPEAVWINKVRIATHRRRLTSNEMTVAKALIVDQLNGRNENDRREASVVRGNKGMPSRAAAKCVTFMTVLTPEEAAACTRNGLGVAGVKWPSGLRPVVALVGNSFAGQWAQQLQRLLPKSVKLVPLTITSCPPWVVGQTNRYDSHGNSCDAHRDFVISTLRELRPGITILSYQRVIPHAAQLKATGLFVRRLEAAGGGRVLMLGPAPQLPSLQQCLSTGRAVTKCNIHLSVRERRAERDDAAVVRAAGGDYISIERLVCAANICPGFIGGLPARNDGVHLSRWAARGVGRFVAAAIQDTANKAG